MLASGVVVLFPLPELVWEEELDEEARHRRRPERPPAADRPAGGVKLETHTGSQGSI
jgi:hypothetical protein